MGAFLLDMRLFDRNLHSQYNMYQLYDMYKCCPPGRENAVEQRLSVTEVRKQLANIIDRVKYEGEGYVIVRRGQAAAAVVPMDVYRRWKAEREELFTVIREVQAANPDADPDRVMTDVLQAQESIRRPLAE